jgi:hypothetical protein
MGHREDSPVARVLKVAAFETLERSCCQTFASSEINLETVEMPYLYLETEAQEAQSTMKAVR